MLLPLVGLTAGWLAGRRSRNVSGFSNFKNSLQAKLFVFLLPLILLLYYYLCISTSFSQLKLIIIFKVCTEVQNNSVAIFSILIPTIKYCTIILMI